MPSKKKRAISSQGQKRKSLPIAQSEIDLLHYLVKSKFDEEQVKADPPSEISIGDVHVDFERQEMFKNGKAIQATTLEFRLLSYLLLHEGKVVSRQQLLRDVWRFEGTPDTRSLDNYILTLRKKIEADPSDPKHILTLRGAGYKFVR
jgi:DNA-binding response OmpR family regulator